MEEKKEDGVGKIVDFIFAKDNRKYVFLIFVAGFLLRLLVSLRISFYADEMVFATHSIGFIDSGKLQGFNQDPVWFFLINLFMNIFGVNVLGLRFLSVILGSLSIILIYLITKEIFNKKIALIASVILAISSYHIINTIGSMDIPMVFFVFLSIYFIILFSKTDKKYFFILIWLSLGVAIMIKQIAVLFIPPFILFLLYHNKKKHNKFKFLQIIYAAIILFFTVIPILTFNFLLYKDKGLVDMQFSRFFGIAKDQYAPIASALPPFSLHALFISYSEGNSSGLFTALKFLYSFESIFILVFALLGIFLIVKSKNQFKWLLFLSLLIPFLFLAGTSLLPNHFVFMALFNAIFSSIGISFISNRFKIEKYKVWAIVAMLFLIIIGSMFQIYQENRGFFGKNELGNLIDFKEKSIEKDSLVIVDSRIYRGKIAFAFWDRHYLETNFFSALMQNLNNFPGETQLSKIYFVEAVTDDSGWGTVKNQPEFNQSTEEIVALFKNQTQLIKTIRDTKGEEHFKIYQGDINFKNSIFEFVDSTHEFFFYPVGYKPESKVFDNYETYDVFDTSLDRFAHLILFLDVFLAILLSLYIFYPLYKSS